MKNGEMVKKKIMAEIVATTSLPVDRLSATDCNAAARAKIHNVGSNINKITESFSIYLHYFRYKSCQK